MYKERARQQLSQTTEAGELSVGQILQMQAKLLFIVDNIMRTMGWASDEKQAAVWGRQVCRP